MINYFIVDTETSGFLGGYHEIHQISLINVKGNSPKECPQLSRDIRIKFPERVNLTSLNISGKSMIDLAVGEKLISPEEMVDQVDDFLNSDGQNPEARCIIAHNAPFDRRFIWATWASQKKRFPASLWLCTQQLGRVWAKSLGLKLDSYSLESMIKFAEVKERGIKHNATVDAQHAYLVWRKAQEKKIDFLPLIKRLPHVIA